MKLNRFVSDNNNDDSPRLGLGLKEALFYGTCFSDQQSQLKSVTSQSKILPSSGFLHSITVNNNANHHHL